MSSVMTDVMVDLETTGSGTGYDHTAIIQIAAIKFNYETEEIGETFDRCLDLAPGRYWDESTREWWLGKNRDVFMKIVARMEDPATVVRAFYDYALRDAPPGGLRFWAKPTSFDFPRVASYMHQFGLPMPFDFRQARDLNTFISGLRGTPERVDMSWVPNAEAHNALADCVAQTKALFFAKAGQFWHQEVLPA